jgi:hypothetical protein
MLNVRKLRKRMTKAQRGQSLVEFSLGLIVLTLILSGILDLGRAYFLFVALEDGAGEGALYLAINPACPIPDISADCTDPNNALYRVTHAGGGRLDWDLPDVDFSLCYDKGFAEVCTDGSDPAFTLPLYGAGTTVSVTIAYPYRLVTPLVSQIAEEVMLTVKATQTIIFEE